MAVNRGDTAGRGKDDGDLQRDDGGKGHKAQRRQEEIDKELDKSLEDFFPVLGPAGHLATDEDRAGGRSQDKAVRGRVAKARNWAAESPSGRLAAPPRAHPVRINDDPVLRA